MSKKKTIINLEIDKNGMDIYLKIKTCKELENFFQKLSENETEVSSHWKDKDDNGLQFYVNNDKNIQIGRALNDNAMYVNNSFGSGLYESGRMNFAILRIVNISKGIKVKCSDLVTFEELRSAVNALGSISKYIYSNYIAKNKIVAKITYEV